MMQRDELLAYLKRTATEADRAYARIERYLETAPPAVVAAFNSDDDVTLPDELHQLCNEWAGLLILESETD